MGCVLLVQRVKLIDQQATSVVQWVMAIKPQNMNLIAQNEIRSSWDNKCSSVEDIHNSMSDVCILYMHHPARTYRMETWTRVFSMDMGIQHEHVAQKWTCDMDMDM